MATKTADIKRPSWLVRPATFQRHVRDAAERAATLTYGNSVHNVAQAMYKTRRDLRKRSRGNVSIHPVNFDGRAGVKVNLYGQPIVWWMPDMDGVPTRFTVTLGSYEANTLTTRRWINGLCRAFHIKFFCWNKDDAPWAMWAYDNSPKLAIQPILPSDLIVAYAR